MFIVSANFKNGIINMFMFLVYEITWCVLETKNIYPHVLSDFLTKDINTEIRTVNLVCCEGPIMLEL